MSEKSPQNISINMSNMERVSDHPKETISVFDSRMAVIPVSPILCYREVVRERFARLYEWVGAHKRDGTAI